MSPRPYSTLEDPEKIIAALRRERDETLAREAALAEVLQVINSSPGDLACVFDGILGRALNLCGAALGYMLSCDGESFHRVASRGSSPALEAALPPPGPTPGSLAERFVRGENIICSTNLVEDNAYRVGAPAARALVDVGGVRSYAAVALRSGARLLGIIAIYRREVHPFSDQQIALLQSFAAQAVIAMENARLLTETREALEQQTATAEVLQVINSSPGDLAPVFDAMLEKAIRVCNAEAGVLCHYDGERFWPVAHRGISEFPREPIRSHPETGAGRLARGEDIVHILDSASGAPVDAGDPGRLALLQLGGARTQLAAALRTDRGLIGTFTIWRKVVRPFSDKQIALLQNFASQAVIAMENARLLTETREALEQQTATAEVLQVINSSPGDLTPVFDAMLEKATRLCEAPFGHLRTWDGERFHLGAAHGEPEFCEWFRQRGPIRPDRDAPLGRILAGERVVHFADAPGDEGYQTSAGFRDMAEASGIRSAIWVALHKDDALLGTITVYRKEVRPFTEKQIALLQNFAAQAVIAMENARLLTETRDALEQQTAIAELLQIINASPGDLAPVFDAMMERATRLCDAAFGVLSTVTEEGYINHRSYSGPSEIVEYFKRRPINRPGPGTTMDRLVRGESCVHVPDLIATDAYRNGDPVRRAMVDTAGARTLISVALRKDATLLGTLSVYRQEVRPFTDKQIALLQNFAAQAVIATENARLLGELRQRTEEVAEFNRGLEARVAAQVEELGRVGRLKRFLAPQLAELIVSQGDEKILESHRRDIVVVFCDLRGYTAFTETAEPEEVLDFLREYHGALGPLVSQYEGTLDQFSGDGIMVFFNDPVPCPDPAERAVNMAMAMREEAGKLIAAWRRHGCELGFGAGIAQGYATLGQIGFSDRSGYTAIGTVCNLAARLCAEAKDGQILVSSRIAEAVDAVVNLEDLGNLELKGLRRPVAVFNVVPSTSAADARPNLTVVARGPRLD